MKNKIVTLKTFLGKTKSNKNTSPRENYWKLIGEKGTVIDVQGTDNRVLVLFNQNLDYFQVENHNPIKNSLWIRVTDLQFEGD